MPNLTEPQNVNDDPVTMQITGEMKGNDAALIAPSPPDVKLFPASTMDNDTPSTDLIPKILFDYLQKDDAKAVVGALLRLLDLCDEDANNNSQSKLHLNIQTAIAAGAPVIIVLVLRKWQINEAVQAVATSCLAAMTHAEKKGAEIASAILTAGGMDAIVQSLNAFPNSRDVQANVMGLLMNLFCPLSTKTLTKSQVKSYNVRFVQELKGLELVENTMDTFPQDEYVQGVCCGLLSNLARHSELHQKIIETGVLVTKVSLALHRHGKNCQELTKYVAVFFHRLGSAIFQTLLD